MPAMQQIADWLKMLGMSEYAQRFADNRIDFSVLRDLTDHDLKDLGIVLGDRRKMLRAIDELDAVSPAAPATPTKPVSQDAAERRQVTVIFSDLVGSTALSARMDPEDLREVISAYQKCVAETVRRFGGFVAKYMGDGVLVYFGYPQAHEDDAERAVRAGLELIAAVAGLKTRALLQTRIGIATGLVVVGDLVGAGEAQERGIVGETPNLAARLQGIAEPNMVVIAESTRARGAPGQEGDSGGEPPPRHFHRQEIRQPRPAVPRPDPGRQHRPDEGRRKIRVSSRLQVLDLRHLVDPAGDHPLDRRSGAHHPHSGAHDRGHQQGRAHEPADAQEIGREPTPEELAEKLRMPLERVRKVLKIAKEPLSLETPIGDEEDSHLGDFIEDKNAILPIDAAIQSNLRETTTRVLAFLSPREERVLRMRFGIGMTSDHTLEEVGQQFSLTRERIRQIEARALRKLKHPSRSSVLRSFLNN